MTNDAAITVDDLIRLRDLEVIIQTAVNHADAGTAALREINERRLYRKKYATFEEYCEKRWGKSADRVYQWLAAETVVQQLPEKCRPLVVNERQARELGKVEPRKRAAVLTAAKAAGPITAASIAVAATKVTPKIQDAVQLDRTGYPIPKKALEYWARQDEVQELLTAITRIKQRLERAVKENDVLFFEIPMDSALNDLEHAYTSIATAKPYAVCTSCQGHVANGKCVMCGGKGMISKYRWERTVPEKTKEIRAKSCK